MHRSSEGGDKPHPYGGYVQHIDSQRVINAVDVCNTLITNVLLTLSLCRVATR